MKYKIQFLAPSLWKNYITLTLAALLISLSATAQTANSVEGDWQALMDLYESTDGPNWTNNSGWPGMTPETMGDAVGIEVNSEGRVVSVDLQRGLKSVDGAQLGGNDLTGTLPESIGNLTQVEYFNVKHNNLTGPIPSSIGNMSSLTHFLLAGQMCSVNLKRSMWNSFTYRQSFTDDCPSSWGGKEMQQTNSFSGQLPATIGNLTNLKVFEARSQYFTGTLPPEMGNLTSLVGLFLDNQRGTDPLGGAIPDSFGNLSSLVHMHLSNTKRDGAGYTSIPEQLTTLSEIAHIRLRNNSISGAIPDFPNATDIRVIALADNNFTGGFPIHFFQGNNGYMSMLDISNNNLSGTISTDMVPPATPTSRSNYHTVSFFDIKGNNFEGPVPDWIQEMEGHQQFKLSGNNLTGSFPKKAAEQKKMRLVWLGGNELSGTLPDVNWQSSSLYSILISGNNFTGSIPKSWESIKTATDRIWRFRAQNNELSGEIPEWFAEIPTLERLKLYNNRFTFKDILPNYDLLRQNIENLELFPQKPFGQARQRKVAEGEQVVLDLSAFDYPGNQYQWTKDGSPISGATSPMLTLSSFSSIDEGQYRLQVTNADLPELGTHASQPMTINIYVSDTN